MASATLDRAIPTGTLWIGEVGLGGELRPVSQVTERLTEAAKLGFTRAVVPRSVKGRAAVSGLEVVAAASLGEALRAAGLTPTA